MGTTSPVFVIGDNGTSSALLIVNGNGNVGIGTSTPSYTLSVNGSTLLGGSATSTGFIYSQGLIGTSTFLGGLSVSALNVGTTTATSTFASGININGLTFTNLGGGGCSGLGNDGKLTTDTNGGVICAADVSGAGGGSYPFTPQIIGGTEHSASTTRPFYFSQGLLAASSTLGYLNVGYIDATSTTATSTFSGGLTVDGNTLVVDWFNNRLGIGTTSPSSLLSVHGNALIAGTTTVSGLIATSTAQIAKGLMIGTTTLASGLTLDGSVTSANGIAGIYEIANLNHASGAAFANRMIVGVNNSAAATSEGLFLRMLDNTSGFGNSQLVRAVEIQADRGSNTQGVNTGIISFGRTFGVQGVTSGTAAGFLVPAGVYAENQGTSTGSAFRAYSATSTTADLVSFFQELSAFTGTGLKMNFGKGTGGSFTGNFLDMQVNDASRFLITSGGTTTVGNGVMQAGLQIGRGGLCVDNDGSCEASTTGRISSVTSTLGASDVAENYFSDEALEPGDVVITKKGTTTSYAFVGKSSSPDEPLFGV